MVAVARGLLVLWAVSVTMVLALDRVQPIAQRGGHSTRLVVGVVAGVALVQIGTAVLRRHGEVWRPVTPWWRRPSSAGYRHEPPAVKELEALIIAAATGGPRARDRLDRRLRALGCDSLAGQLAPDQPTADQVLEAIDQILVTRSRSSQGSHDR